MATTILPFTRPEPREVEVSDIAAEEYGRLRAAAARVVAARVGDGLTRQELFAMLDLPALDEQAVA